MAIKFLNTVAVDTNVLYVDAASNEVGIGTTSPGSKLEVVEARSGSSASDQTHYTLVSKSTISSGTPGTGGIKVVYDDGSNEHAFGLVAGSSSADFLTSGPMHWYTNSDLNTHSATGFAMTIDTSQRVGIGTTSPTTDLHVEGNSLVTSNATVRGDLRIDKNPSSYPSAKLQFLKNGVTSPAMGEIIMNDNPGHQGMYMYARRSSSPYTTSYIELPTSTNYDFEINLLGNNAVTIDSYSRNVGIGTTNPSEKLEVVGNAILDSSNAKLKIKAGGSGTVGSIDFTFNTDSTQYGLIDLNYDSRVSQGFRMKSLYPITLDAVTAQKFLISGSEKMQINSSGNVGIATASPRTKLDINGPLAVVGGTFTSGTSGADSNSASGIVLRRGKKILSGIPSSGNEDFYLRNLIEHDTGNNINIGQTGTSLIGNVTLSTGASGNVIFRTTGSESVRIDSSGNVGIGTTSPDTKLHVEGNLLVDAYNVGENNGIFLREGFLTTDQPSITVWDMSNSGASPDGLSLNAQDGIRFRENGGEVARFKDGFFGINKTSPATMLHVEGDTTLDRKTQLRLPSFSMGASSITDEYLVIARKHDGSSTKINATGIQGTITFGRGSTSSGNKSAIYKLSVQSAYNTNLVEEFSYVGGTQVFTSLDVIDVGGTEYYALKVMTTGGGQIDNRCYAEGLLLTDGDSNIFSKVRVSDSNVSLVTSGVLLPLRYKTMSEGVARIQSPSGYVEIGPQNSSYSHFSTDRSRFYFNKRIVVDEGIISTYNEQMQLQAPLGTTRMYLNNLNGNCSIGVQDSNARLTLKGTTGTGASNLLRIMSETAFTSTPGRMIEFFRSNGSSRGNIYMNQYGIGTSSSSDYRLKKNISLISDGIDRVKLLKPSRFNWTEGPDDYFQDGFIAHEVEQVVPEAIAGEKDGVDSNGEPIYQGIDQVKIVPLLTAALKEAIAKIENLETRIQTLENN